MDELEQLRKTTDKQATYIVELEMLLGKFNEHIVNAPVVYEPQPALFPDPATIGEEQVEAWVTKTMSLHAQAIHLMSRPAGDHGDAQASR